MKEIAPASNLHPTAESHKYEDDGSLGVKLAELIQYAVKLG